MNITSIVRKAFLARQKQLERYATQAEALQQGVLHYLVSTAKETEYGRKHMFGNIRSYENFMANVPVNTYEELKTDIDRMPSHQALPTTRASSYP